MVLSAYPIPYTYHDMPYLPAPFLPPYPCLPACPLPTPSFWFCPFALLGPPLPSSVLPDLAFPTGQTGAPALPIPYSPPGDYSLSPPTAVCYCLLVPFPVPHTPFPLQVPFWVRSFWLSLVSHLLSTPSFPCLLPFTCPHAPAPPCTPHLTPTLSVTSLPLPTGTRLAGFALPGYTQFPGTWCCPPYQVCCTLCLMPLHVWWCVCACPMPAVALLRQTCPVHTPLFPRTCLCLAPATWSPPLWLTW